MLASPAPRSHPSMMACPFPCPQLPAGTPPAVSTRFSLRWPYPSHLRGISPIVLIHLPPSRARLGLRQAGRNARAIYRQSKHFSSARPPLSLCWVGIPLLTGCVPASRVLPAAAYNRSFYRPTHTRLPAAFRSRGDSGPLSACEVWVSLWADATQLFAHVALCRRGILRALEAGLPRCDWVGGIRSHRGDIVPLRS